MYARYKVHSIDSPIQQAVYVHYVTHYNNIKHLSSSPQFLDPPPSFDLLPPAVVVAVAAPEASQAPLPAEKCR